MPHLLRLIAAAVSAFALFAPAAGAVTLPPGFQQDTALSGFTDPMDLEIAPGGRVFVAEKSGVIRTFDDLSDPTPTTFADLRTEVHNYSSRGLVGMAVDPGFPAEPYIYVYYTLDAPIGGTPPTFGAPGQTHDSCPGGGPDFENCLVSSRLSRLRVQGDQMDGPEQVLINDWCGQFAFHTGGGIEFGADGYLYVSGGDGARWEIFDYGQLGNPMNPCADPPGPVGGPMSPPTAEGGRLRSQDLRTAGDPLSLDGSLVRVDPDTGEGAPGNPMFASAEPNARRMLAHGFRNPARLAIRPGTNDVWVADRGGGYWEELDRVEPTDPVRNFGWPCYEGGLDADGVPYARVRPRSDDQDLNICENLYAEVTATSAPFWGYDHELPVVQGENCNTDPGTGEPAGNQIAGVNFYPASGSFPAAYRGALFFADRLRDCMYAMLPGTDGVPERGRVIPFAQGAERAMDIEVAPGGDLLYVDQADESVQRIAWTGNSSNQPPTAVAQADTVTGNRPLTVTFGAAGTSDPDPGDLLIYEWDLDGDGEFDDSSETAPVHTFLAGGTFEVALRVTDTSGAFDTDTLTITVGSGPVGTIETPAPGTTWATGDVISFTGSGWDAVDGDLPPTALDWIVALVHCNTPEDCHEYELANVPDSAGGTVTAPDHAYPSYIEIRLTTTNSIGETEHKTRRLDPRTATLSVDTSPPGATVTIDGADFTAPVARQAIVGSTHSLTTPAQVAIANTTYRFSSWSDGQAQARTVTVPASGASHVARFAPFEPGQSTLTFSPAADARVEAGLANTNLGADPQLRTDSGGSDAAETYMRFIVGGITGRVTSAKLRVRSVTETVDGPALRGTTGGWTETAVTWTNRPATTTGVVSDVGVIDPGTWAEWDVTPLVAVDGTVNLHLSQTSTDGVSYHSREASNPASRPELVVTTVNDAYTRPKGATPTRLTLVPAYDECTAPNRVHGPPLEHPSCSPPAQESSSLTVGSQPAASTGYVLLRVVVGVPSNPEDDADVALDFRMSDVRHSGSLLDYGGELQFRATLRLTDRDGTPGGTGTSQDFVMPVTVPCAATLDPLLGSDCDVSTTADALTPGMVREGARAMWQLGDVDVLDGGSDGDVDTPGNAVFARPGVFVP